MFFLFPSPRNEEEAGEKSHQEKSGSGGTFPPFSADIRGIFFRLLHAMTGKSESS